MDCSICGKEYISWQGLFYHKRKVHNCENVHSSRYEYEIKNAAKIAGEKEREKTRKCMFCHRCLRRLTMERHCLKMHKENFMWMNYIICDREHQEEMLADHIRGHNVYLKRRILHGT